MSPLPPLQVCRLGRISYRDAWGLQKQLAALRKKDLVEDTLLLLEHDPVITYGRNVGRGSLLLEERSLAHRGVELVESDRGGDATFHGPGQLVAYPIIDLKVDMQDVRKYVWSLEECMILVMADYGVKGDRVKGAPGAWVKAEPPYGIDQKMGAVGVRLSRWVTHHGIGFNVQTDLSYFQLIIPCGLTDKGVTSLEQQVCQLKGTTTLLDFKTVQDHFIRHFARLFKRDVIEVTPMDLDQMIEVTTQLIEESP